MASSERDKQLYSLTSRRRCAEGGRMVHFRSPFQHFSESNRSVHFRRLLASPAHLQIASPSPVSTSKSEYAAEIDTLIQISVPPSTRVPRFKCRLFDHYVVLMLMRTTCLFSNVLPHVHACINLFSIVVWGSHVTPTWPTRALLRKRTRHTCIESAYSVAVFYTL